MISDLKEKRVEFKKAEEFYKGCLESLSKGDQSLADEIQQHQNILLFLKEKEEKTALVMDLNTDRSPQETVQPSLTPMLHDLTGAQDIKFLESPQTIEAINDPKIVKRPVEYKSFFLNSSKKKPHLPKTPYKNRPPLIHGSKNDVDKQQTPCPISAPVQDAEKEYPPLLTPPMARTEEGGSPTLTARQSVENLLDNLPADACDSLPFSSQNRKPRNPAGKNTPLLPHPVSRIKSALKKKDTKTKEPKNLETAKKVTFATLETQP
jgi:hypothetical protein